MAGDLHSALDAAEFLPHGLARLRAVERVVAEVVADGRPDLLLRAYQLQVDSYTFDGEREKSFVPFSRVLQMYDSTPELFDRGAEHSLFWSFKWMTGGLMWFPGVGRDQIEATIDDMERRYREAGNGLSAIHHTRTSWAAHLGDHEAIRRSLALSAATPRDAFTNCQACVYSEYGYAYDVLGEPERAATEFGRVIDGRMSCYTEPQEALGGILRPLLALGRVPDAVAAHRRGLGVVRRDPLFVAMLGPHLRFLARTGNADRGRDLVVEHLDLFGRTKTPWGRMTLLASAAGVLRQAPPADVEVPYGGRPVALSELADVLATEASGLAAQFDARNRTDAVGRQVAAMLDLPAVVDRRVALGRR